MKIATWNVNSLKIRLPQVLDWIALVQPDVLALQETKLTDSFFPFREIEAAGYHVIASGQKTYNGVALLSKEPAHDVVTDVPNLEETERRILGATIYDIKILNLYVVNGQELGSEKYRYKLRWLERIAEHVARELAQSGKMVVLGDFNVAPEDRDTYDPEVWRERILCSTPERARLKQLLDLGLRDTFRLFPQPENSFSWWDYRAGAFRQNRGLRIDLILASEALSSACTRCIIDKAPRRLQRPSDHTPVLAEFAC